jgi:hypothetical protein
MTTAEKIVMFTSVFQDEEKHIFLHSPNKKEKEKKNKEPLFFLSQK